MLLNGRPASGFSPNDIRELVRRAETDIAEQYVKEVHPILDPRFDLKRFVREFVSSTILDRAAIERDTRAFIGDYAMTWRADIADSASDLCRPFETLYDLGLLGFAWHVPDSTTVTQRFRPPGQGVRDAAERTLPDSELFVLHPVLHHLVKRERRSARFIIGSELPLPLF
jgi:hypothetical protein